MKLKYYTLGRRVRQLSTRPGDPGPGEFPDHSFSAWLLRPYLDLSPIARGPIHSYGIECAYRQLIDLDLQVLPLQTHPSPVLRQALLQENGLVSYAIQHPADLPEAVRTDRWKVLVEHLQHFPALAPEQRVRTITLLERLTFYSLVIDLIPATIDSQIDRDSESARLAAKRAIAIQKTTPGDPAYAATLSRVALAGSGSPHCRLLAATALVVFYSKNEPDLSAARYWAQVSETIYRDLRPDTDWYDSLYASMYWRAVSFVPFTTGDRSETTRRLDRAQDYAYAITPETDLQRLVRAENIHPLIETRTKEALWLGDHPLALERARALAAHDPLDPKVHIQLGDILLGLKQVELALQAYRVALSLGAPFTPFAWFMIGHCQEQLGNLEEAGSAYQSALRADPWGVTAAQRLRVIAQQLEWSAVREWAETLLERMRRIRPATQSVPQPG